MALVSNHGLWSSFATVTVEMLGKTESSFPAPQLDDGNPARPPAFRFKRCAIMMLPVPDRIKRAGRNLPHQDGWQRSQWPDHDS